MNKSIKSNSPNKLTTALLIIYLLALCWILIFKLGVRFSYMESRSISLIPFREAFLFNGRVNYGETIANLLIFVPLGLYTSVLFRSLNFWKKVLLFTACSFLIEAIQFIFRIGAFDITDIITNTLGGILGTMMYFLLQRLLRSEYQAQKMVNLFATIGICLMIILMVLLKMNMLPIRYQ